MTVTDAATASKFDLQGRKALNAMVVGGSAGVWRNIEGSRMRWGVRGEVARQRADADAQTLNVSGTLFGRPYSGPLPVPELEGSATFYTGTFLVGWRFGADAGHGAGRVNPYV